MNKIFQYIITISLLILLNSCSPKEVCVDEIEFSNEHIQYKTVIKSFCNDSVRNYAKCSGRPHNASLFVAKPPKEFMDVVNIGKPIVPILIQLMDCNNEYIRCAAYDALTRITNKRFGNFRIYRNNKKNGIKLRKKAINTWNHWWDLNKEGSYQDWITADLYSSNKITRISAILITGENNYTSAIPHLINLLENQDMSFYATESLARMQNPHAIPYLVDLYLTQDNSGYRKSGISYLISLTGTSLGYDPNSEKMKREKAIQRWRQKIEDTQCATTK
jgi:hypothetical protein